jgi:prepilin-type N-terminal cleavage/methylation domain-containing protein
MQRQQAGFTLIELMISLVIFSLAIASVLAVAVSMAQSFRQRRNLVNAEDNVRGAMDFISDALRGASPAIPQTGTIRYDATCNTIAGGGITLNNSTTGPDDFDVVYAAGGVVTSTRTPYFNGAITIDITDVTNITAGDELMITDLANGEIVKVGTIVTTTAPAGTITVTPSACGSFTTTYPALSLVLRVQRAHFFIDTTNTYGFGADTLMMDLDYDSQPSPEPLAEGLEDMQLSLGLDSTSSFGPVDTWEYSSGTGVASGTLRAARITFVVKDKQALPGTATPFRRPAAEDHPAAATFDAYPRRILSSSVELRNLKGSP